MKKRRLMLCSLVSLIMVFVMAVPMTVSADAATKVAKIGDIEYATLEEAFTAASSTGGTITLLDNAENCPHVIILESGKKVTLDLNGHDVSFAKDKFIKITHGNLNITGKGTIYESEPDLGPIIMKGSAADVADYSVVTVGKDVTLRGWAALFIDQNKAENYGITANVYGTLEGKKDVSGSNGLALYVNGGITASTGNVPKITLDGATLTCESGIGMYLAGYADTTMKNCTVTSSSEGSTGIEIRAGKLDITDCVISGGAGNYEQNPNANGSTTANAALAIAQHTTKLPVEVTVYDGTFTGGAAVAQGNPQSNDANAVANVKLNLKNGSYEGLVSSENVKKFISGGEYAQEIDAAYLASDVVTATYEVDGVKTYLVGKDTVNKKLNTAKSGTIIITNAPEGTTLDAPKNGVTLTNGSDKTIIAGSGNEKVELGKEQTYKKPATDPIKPSQDQTQKPSDTAKADKSAKTGDDFNLFAVGGVALAAIIAMAAVAITGRRHRQR